MKKTHSLGLNSVNFLVALAASKELVPLPQGVLLRNEAEMLIWHQCTQSRARDSWRELDLLLLAKVVRLEADIRGVFAELDKLEAGQGSECRVAALSPFCQSSANCSASSCQ